MSKDEREVFSVICESKSLTVASSASVRVKAPAGARNLALILGFDVYF